MDLQSLEAVYGEMAMLDKMNNQNIIKNLSFFENDVFMCIVTDLMIFDIRKMLDTFREPLTESLAKTIFK